MSSDDANDDSGFDKEAEREKLREKYGQEDDRENTRRMSELLLQGATMTGKHCGDCGDPIFRYDGQEFCPSCQREVEGNRAEGGSPEDGRTSAESEDSSPDGSISEAAERPSPEAADRSATADGDAGESDDEPRVEIEGVRVADGHVDRSNLRDPPSQQSGEDGRPGGGDGRSGDSSREHARDAGGNGRGRDAHGNERGHAHDRGERGERATGAGDLDPARESLVRTLTDLSRRAEDTDDATHARELLAATREAAEALAALDRANR